MFLWCSTPYVLQCRCICLRTFSIRNLLDSNDLLKSLLISSFKGWRNTMQTLWNSLENNRFCQQGISPFLETLEAPIGTQQSPAPSLWSKKTLPVKHGTAFIPYTIKEAPVNAIYTTPLAQHIMEKNQYLLLAFLRIPDVELKRSFPNHPPLRSQYQKSLWKMKLQLNCSNCDMIKSWLMTHATRIFKMLS